MKRNILLLLGIFVLISSASALETTCSSCSGCTTKLDGSYDVVKLDADIADYADTCINFSANNIEFDCQGHTIDGDGSYLSYGVYVGERSWNTVKNCTVIDFDKGIYLYYSSSNTVTSNTLSNNYYGIHLLYSSNNTLSGNTFTNDGLYVYGSYQNTVEDSTVNGRPLVYLEGASNQVVEEAGQVILVSCDNITMDGLNVSDTDVGIKLWETHNCRISNNTASNNGITGISLYYSSNNTLTSNTADSNTYYGIHLYSSDSNTFTSNTADSNSHGIEMYSSSNNTFTSNTADLNNGNGIWFYNSDSNTFTSNTFSNNNYGIYIYNSDSNTLNSNTFCDNTYSDFYFMGTSLLNSGDENTCDEPDDWNDDGTSGCTYACSGGTTTTTSTTTTTTISGECTLVGDTEPCDTITLSEVIDLISLWAADGATLSNVIDLINAWAG